ncbi:winged helix-turn-helix transcriptional regulator [Paenibacillus aurantiacus]|uniref:Winged helix-turn-helix transcriptional regulator n=1 Tax=Paenibacillus aurantiacus TaxID=1936118 RepID=A0ABV5KUG9_9BACL
MPHPSQPGYEPESPCHYRRALEVVSSKWTVLVFYELEEGSKRYSELKKRIEGVTQKMLTQTLRQLERDGLVKRCVYPTVPQTVDYTLTTLGLTLIEPMRILHRWTEAHYDSVLQARRAYDGRLDAADGAEPDLADAANSDSD